MEVKMFHDKFSLARLIDHALLAPDLTDQEIADGLALAREAGCFSACVHPADVETALRLLEGSKTAVCAVVDFPLGKQTTLFKALEAAMAYKMGAAELDLVLNIGYLKSGRHSDLRAEIETVVNAAPVPVKAILETCYLTTAEKVAACEICMAAGAKFVKTSTGFGPGGATVEDVALLRKTVGKSLGVKAAGGIATLKTARQMIDAGANRIGTSRTTAILKDL